MLPTAAPLPVVEDEAVEGDRIVLELDSVEVFESEVEPVRSEDPG
jgi:hypothetical protein